MGVSAALAIGSLAACGDGDDDASTSSEAEAALTSDELVSQSNEVCAEHNAAIADGIAVMQEETGGKPDEVALRALVKDVVTPQYTAWIGTLDTYVPPEELTTDWDTWIEDSYLIRDEIKGDPALTFETEPFVAVNEQATALGLGEDCLAGPA